MLEADDRGIEEEREEIEEEEEEELLDAGDIRDIRRGDTEVEGGEMDDLKGMSVVPLKAREG